MRMKAWPAQGRVQVPVCHTCNPTQNCQKLRLGLFSPVEGLHPDGRRLSEEPAGRCPCSPPYHRPVHSSLYTRTPVSCFPSLKVAGLSDGRVATTSGSSQCCRIPTGKTLNDPLLGRNPKKSGRNPEYSGRNPKNKESCHYQR